MENNKNKKINLDVKKENKLSKTNKKTTQNSPRRCKGQFIPLETELNIEDVNKPEEIVSTEAVVVEREKKRGITKAQKIAIAAASGVLVAGATLGTVIALTRDDKVNVAYYVDGQKYELQIKSASALLNSSVPKVVGYDFAGWYLDEGLTQKVSEDYIFKKDTVVYLKFVPKTCEVEYFANNGTGESAVQNVVFDTEYNIVENAFTRANYTFVGWSESPNTHYEDNGVISVGQARTLTTEGAQYYAVWKGVDKTITFNSSELVVDGENYTFANETIPYGEKYTLPTIDGVVSNKLDYEKKFAGYVINGQVFAAGAEVIIVGDTQISINWTDKDSILYFNLNLPTGETASSIEPQSFSTTLAEYVYLNLPQLPNLVNYEFKCWNTRPDGTGTNYNATESFSTTNQMNVLYAVWVGKERTINIYNQGTVVETFTLRYGDSLELPVYTLANYTFVGFNDASNFTGNVYSGNINVLFEDEVVNLYAQYTRNQVTITFNTNGGNGSLSGMSVNTNETYTFSADEISAQRTSLTRQYYTFVGWSENENALPADASFEIEVNETAVELFAIWERKTTQLTFVSDGETPINVTVSQGDNYTFVEDGFEKDGYELDGFMYDGTKYAVGDTIFVGEIGFEIEVVWKIAQLVAFDVDVAGIKTIDNEKIALLDIEEGDAFYAPNVTAERSCYDDSGVRYYFAGWSTNRDATIPDVYVGESVITAVSPAQHFYAVYMPASECLIYTEDADSVTVSLDYSVVEILIIPNIYNGKPVTTIGDFSSSEISRVFVSDSVTSIEDNAFSWCYDLTRVVFAEGSLLKYVGNSAFGCCENLNSIEIPASVTTIGNEAFNFSGLTSINIPEGVTTIGDNAFYYCESLTSIEIPSSVTSIGVGAFEGCGGLTSIEIPSSVTSIGAGSFCYCENLQYIFMLSTTPSYDMDISGLNDDVIIYVPDDYVDEYKSQYTDYEDRILPISQFEE